ncbi:EthD domain-containing protein [Mycolicibacterium goodii]|uniref:EthD domain-containing protein n=1 Tax=Mycolicibacterium goodii TaxID=134601 RepID=UPI001BDC8A6B|nr:EthD domain-containing protein [Mycolicibacterium goodii]MBU8812657.1 EthD domain-containing protein [Mycolicibacterium goodii]
MEKVIVTMRSECADDDWCARMVDEVSAGLLEIGPPGLVLNIRDAPVRDSLMTLTTLDPPVVALVSVWVHQYYGHQLRAVLELLGGECDSVAAYLVTESVPLPPSAFAPGHRAEALANVALLRRPADLDAATWLHRWHVDHTPVAIETQATFGYVQNTVVRALTRDAPVIDGIVEELFPPRAVTDLHAFFGAPDDEELARRMQAMVASTDAFGASVDIDTVPTSRYLWRSPFAVPDAAGGTCSS